MDVVADGKTRSLDRLRAYLNEQKAIPIKRMIGVN